MATRLGPVRILGLMAAGAVIMGAVAPAASTAAQVGSANDLSRFYAQRVSWQPCGDQLECATVLVPLDYNKPSKQTVSIAVNRRLTAGPGAPSLLFNPGGPGGSGVSFVASADSVKLVLNPATPSVQGAFNIVGFDPRGVGASLPLECMTQAQLDAFTRDNPVTAKQQAARAAAEKRLGQNCFSIGRGLVSNIGTEMVARDLDIIRAALGEAKLDYYGASYGTYIGQVYAHLFPGKVGRMVLDSVESPTASEVDLAGMQARSFEEAFNHWAATCATRKTCPAPAGTPPAQIAAWATGLMNDLATNPIDIGTSRGFSQGDALTFASTLITQGGQVGPIALDYFFEALAQKVVKVLAQIQPSAIGTANSWSVNAAVMCFDRPMNGTLADTVDLASSWAKSAPTFGAYYAWFTQKCNTWPVRRGQPIASVTPVTKAPVLLVSSRHDPNTPHEWAVAASKLFSNNGLLTWEGWGHVSGTRANLCVNNAVGAYLVSGTLPAKGATCPEVDQPSQ